MVFIGVSISLRAQIKGDINGDGIVTITDALCISQKHAGIEVKSYNENMADIDCNGKIEVNDSILIAQFYVKNIPDMLCTVLPKTKTKSITPKEEFFIISSSITKGGKIIPQGNIFVKNGESITFRFYSNKDYAINSIIVDGKLKTNFEGKNKDNYIFRYVKANHTIEIVFRRAKLTWNRYGVKFDENNENAIGAPCIFETATFYSPFPIHTEMNLYKLWGNTPVLSKIFDKWIIESGKADIEDIYNNKTIIFNIYGDTVIKAIYKKTDVIIIQ